MNTDQPLRVAVSILALLSLASFACEGKPSVPPTQQARTLMEQGQIDAALATLKGSKDVDGLYLQGVLWSKKAAADGAPAPASGLKPEQETALEFFRKTVAAQPQHREAHRGIAEILLAAGRTEEAESALRAWNQQDPENADPLVLLGDLLLESKKDPEDAVAHYQAALTWLPKDEGIKGKVADVYMNIGSERLAKKEYSAAESSLKEAQKFVDAKSPRGAKLRELMDRLVKVRPSAFRRN